MKLYHADCREVMSKIDSGSVDCIICDPPYYSTGLDFDKDQRIDFKSDFVADEVAVLAK